MATVTRHIFSSDGSLIRRGTASVADGDTLNTGLSTASGVVFTSLSDDVVVNARSISGGTVTMSVFAAGSASASEQTIYWEAWNNQKI